MSVELFFNTIGNAGFMSFKNINKAASCSKMPNPLINNKNSRGTNQYIGNENVSMVAPIKSIKNNLNCLES